MSRDAGRGLSWLCALLLAVHSGCGASSSAPIAATQASQRAPQAAEIPMAYDSWALVVTSTYNCDGDERHDAVRQLLNNDGQSFKDALQKKLGPDRTIQLSNPTSAALAAEIAKLPARAKLIFVYSGHGTDGREDAPAPESSLCLAPNSGSLAEPLKARTLVSWLSMRQLAQAWLVINACRSAFFDVSESTRPMSVFSVSPEDVSEWSPRVSDSRQTTHFADALLRALADGAALDTSCDGWVSDREVLQAVTGALRQNTALEFVRRNRIMPTLRREAARPLQLWPQTRTEACRRKLERAKPALAQNVELKVGSYFYLIGPDAHAACLGNAAAHGGNTPSAVEAALCSLAQAAGYVPLPVSAEFMGLGACRPHEDCVPDAVQTLAETIDFAEIYAFRLEDRWIHVDRLRDRRRVATTRGGPQELDLPRANQIVASWPGGDYIARFAGRVPRLEALTESELRRAVEQTPRTVAVCAEPEGQCFYARGGEWK